MTLIPTRLLAVFATSLQTYVWNFINYDMIQCDKYNEFNVVWKTDSVISLV